LLSYFIDSFYTPYVFMLLAIGPILGLFILIKPSKTEKDFNKKILF